MEAQDLLDENLGQAFTSAVRSNDDPAEEAVGVAVLGGLIHDHSQVSRGAVVIRDPQVLGSRLLIAVVELLLVDALLDEEHVGAQLEEGVELVGRQFSPSLTDDGTFGHGLEFNRVTPKERPMSDTTGSYKVQKTEAEWLAELGPERYAILRKASTERAWTGELLDESRAGLYTCAACGNELFKSGTKFDSHCGWPSFYESINPDAVELLEDRTLGVVRTEVRCANCGSHLGHVFDDGFGTPTGDRYCMNSLSLEFKEEE